MSSDVEATITDETAKLAENDRFADTFFVLWNSYQKKRGRTLDPEQVQVLVDAFAEVSQSQKEAQQIVEQQDQVIERLNAEIAELKERKSRLWQPKK